MAISFFLLLLSTYQEQLHTVEDTRGCAPQARGI